MGAMATMTQGLPLTIQQVSAATGVHKATLRHWEKLFEGYLSPQRSGGGHRLYTAEDLQRILALKRLLKEEGFTVEGARRRLSLEQTAQN